jgi:hypothetical protein
MTLARHTPVISRPPLKLDPNTISRLALMFLAGHMAVLLYSQPNRALATLHPLEQLSLAGRMAISLDFQRGPALAILNRLVPVPQTTHSASNSPLLNPRLVLDCR